MAKEVILEVLHPRGCLLRSNLWEYVVMQIALGHLGMRYGGTMDELQISVYLDGERIIAKKPEVMEDDS